MRTIYWTKIPLYAVVAVMGLYFMVDAHGSDMMRVMGLVQAIVGLTMMALFIVQLTKTEK